MTPEQQAFEDRCWEHYLAERARRTLPGDVDGEPTRESLFWRREDGSYGVLAFNTAWMAYQWGRQDAQIGQGEPVAFMSSKQLPALKDPEDEGGKYIPLRKTKLGNFDLPLYTHQAPQQKPLTDEPDIAACGLMPLIEDYAIAVHNGDENSGTVLKRTIEASLEELESQQKKPLTQDQIKDCAWGLFDDSSSLPEFVEPFVRAIESAATEPLLQRIAEFVTALDEEMVVSHLGVFNLGDDPKKQSRI